MTSAKKTCHKRRFPNEYEAEKWLKRLLTHVGRGDVIETVPRRVYYHPACDGFHTTKRPRWEDNEPGSRRERLPDALLYEGRGT